MIDYSLIYTVIFSILMSVSASVGLICTGLKRHYSAFSGFLMLCIPKTVFSLVRYYFENYESNFFLLVVLLLSMMIFDVILLFVVFDCPAIQKIIYIAMMDIIFMPVLLIKQAFESKYLNENNMLEFDSFLHILIPLICYTATFIAMVFGVHLLGKLINKINFDTKIFDIFGILALAGYLINELIASVMFWENLAGRTNQFNQYFMCALIYCCSLLIMYLISNYLTKRRLIREIEVLNTEKEREFRYYNLMKNHNEEIQKIKHDLSGHFNVLTALTKNKEYEKLEDYISGLSENYSKIQRVVYTSNIMADAVISSIVEKCKKNAICFECEGTISDSYNIDDISLTCIFSNILDNAFEACNQVNSDRFIKLSVFCKSDCVVINCKNSKSENQKDGFLKTTKSENGHGFGIKIIKEIVSNYDGVISFEDNGNEFEVSLLIPQKAVSVT